MRLLSQINRIHEKAWRLADNIGNFSTRKEIARSGFFDADWYLLSHPYLVRDGIDPLTHFIKNGRRHLLSPSRKFDTARYLDQHADAVASGINPLVHYLRQGKRDGLSIWETPPSAADRIKSSGLFDDRWYLNTYADARESGQPPLLHYLVQGYRDGKSPGPDFDAAWYSRHYPDIGGIDPLLHYIDHGRDEGRAPVRPLRILQLAKETVGSVEDLEPELYSADFFEHADNIAIASGPARHPLSRSFEEIVKAVPAPPRAIVFVPWLIHGGANLVASHAVEALAKEHGPKSVVVVTTDDDRLEALHLVPEGVTVISLIRSDQRLSEGSRKDLVDLIVRGLQPDVVLNVNSRACWEAYKYFGRRLSNFSRLYAMLSCPDYSEQGRRTAYSDLYIPHCLPNLSGVYFDNRTYISNLSSQLGVPGELQRLFVPLYQPAPRQTPPDPRAEKSRRLQVLWAGRLARQKNVQLLADIARDAPQFDFHIWGRGEKEFEKIVTDLQERCDNVQFHGRYDRFNELPLPEYDALLYTSLWDGLPNVLLEAAAAGLPIVSSDVGGIGELVDQQTSWLVSSLTDTAPYIDALSTIAGNQAQVHAKKKEMAQRLEDRHGWDRYLQTLAAEPRKTFGLLMPKSLLV